MSLCSYAGSRDDLEPLPDLLRDGKRFFRSYGGLSSEENGAHDTVTLAVASKLRHNPHPQVAKIYEVFPTYFDCEVVDSECLWNLGEAQAVCERMINVARIIKDHFQSLGIYMCMWGTECFGLSDDGVMKFYSSDFSYAKYLGYASLDVHWLTEEAKEHGLVTAKELDDHAFDDWVKFLRSA